MRRLILLLMLVFTFSAATYCGFFLYAPIIINQDLHYILKPNTNARILASDLSKLTNLKYPKIFCWLMEFRGNDKKLKTGEYLFPRGSNILQVIDKVINGKIFYRRFTIINGWNFYKTFMVLEKTPAIKHVLAGKSQAAIAKMMGLKHKTPEGMLFPETYFYTLGMTDLQLLKRAHNEMQRCLREQWPKRAKHFPLKTKYAALVIASMIEKEAHVNKEKPLVASVILNRLDKWMKLQIDATVIYGMGKKFNGDLTRKDLRAKTAYNTYVHYGLPPTPIAMPGEESIKAALHPAQTDLLYFVATKNGDHVFSKTLKQHNKNVVKYQLN